jgi:hypothetical protein
MKSPKPIEPQPFLKYLLLAALLAVATTGCATYQQKNKVVRYWDRGDLPAAANAATKLADENANGKDAIIWRLEEGTTLRAIGQFQASNEAFDQAQNKMEEYARQAKVKVGHEAGALLSNQANLPYTGRAYDGIMLNTYEALNYLALGEPDKARPELIHAYQRQQDAVEENKKRIEKVQAEAAEQTNSAAIQQAQQDPGFQSSLQNNYANLNGLKAYADYVNPFTVYLDGIYFLANAMDASDLGRAQKSLERVQEFIGDNPYLKADLATVADRLNGKPIAPTTYVIFETGCAPQRGQIRIDVPIIISRVSYLGAAFPTLQLQGYYVPTLLVTANGTTTSTVLLSSMDSVIGLDFKNELPIIITKTIAATVAKAVAAYALNATANQSSWEVGLVSQIVTAGYQLAVNIADTRTWTTLPKEFQFCRFPTPSNRQVELSTPDGLQKTTVTLNNGLVNLIYVKSINPGTAMLVTQMKLK